MCFFNSHDSIPSPLRLKCQSCFGFGVSGKTHNTPPFVLPIVSEQTHRHTHTPTQTSLSNAAVCAPQVQAHFYYRNKLRGWLTWAAETISDCLKKKRGKKKPKKAHSVSDGSVSITWNCAIAVQDALVKAAIYWEGRRD